MKKKLSLLITVITVVFASVFALPAASAEEEIPCIILNSSYADENNIATVTASIDKETDLAAYSISLEFNPDMLEFADAVCNTGYGSFYPGDSAEDYVTLVWSDSQNNTLNGKLFTVKFKTKNKTAGMSIPVEIGHSILGNESSEEIKFDAVGCGINIIKDYNWGDSNCDGIITVCDAVMAARYNINTENYPLSKKQLINCDTDSNGIINSKDLYILLNHIISVMEER